MQVNRCEHELFAVFSADDDYAPMIIVPARDADHAIERTRTIRAAFPAMRLGSPARSRLVDSVLDMDWSGVGVFPEVVLRAIEHDLSRQHERPLERSADYASALSAANKSR